MIANSQDFHSLLKKINSGLEKFDEFIFPYSASPEKIDNPLFDSTKFEETKNSRLFHYRTNDFLKILFYLFREKIYPLKDY